MGRRSAVRTGLAALIGLALLAAACSDDGSTESAAPDPAGPAEQPGADEPTGEPDGADTTAEQASDDQPPADDDRGTDGSTGPEPDPDSDEAADPAGDPQDADGSTDPEPDPDSDPDSEEAVDPDSEEAGEPEDGGVQTLRELLRGGPGSFVPTARGDSGDEVLALQERLAELGFAPGTPDGDYGGRTERAVAAFQQLVSLQATGDADRGTLTALSNYRYDGLLLRAGDEGEEVEALQRRLADGPFDPGPADGVYGTTTVQAVWALEKLAGVPVDGDWGPLDEQAWTSLQDGEIGAPENEHDQRWVEVDLSEQLMKVYDPGETTPTLISHASSGSGIPWSNEEHSGSSVTPLGEFHINRRISGWRESSLDIGRLYNPLYFNGGIAFHGATSVPLHPASHGCVRLPMHVAEYLPDELPNGTPVHVLA